MKWFCADTHLGHSKVLIGERGKQFPEIEQWNQHCISEINRVVNRNDTLFILGDFCLKNPNLWRPKIKCRDAWLIIGNHDQSQSQLDVAFGKGKARLTYETHALDIPCFLSHYAHAFWPKSHRGSCHLYGHNHDQREETLDSWMPDRRSSDVSPETAFRLTVEWRPLSETEIHAMLSVRKSHDHVEFYEAKRGKFTTEICEE